ncbi:MAG: penicillin-binding protein activator LpoB [Planctomycetes bacterium]|nr:penicillin-binding protein activator LpoB [Planctomycetota bacterium]
MKHLKLTLVAAALAAFTLTPSCSTVAYGDPQAEETINIDFGSTDLQEFTRTMVKSLVGSPNLAYLDGPGKRDDKRVICYMGGVDNRTKEHIDTEAITDSIRTELLQSGRFRFVADQKGQDQIGQQVRFQNDGRVNPEMAKQFGKQLGADMIVYGSLVSIEKKKGRSIESGGTKLEDVYYLFVLNATNIETGEIVWSEKKELRKKQRTGLFGSR